jgi:hypothetical protein
MKTARDGQQGIKINSEHSANTGTVTLPHDIQQTSVFASSIV